MLSGGMGLHLPSNARRGLVVSDLHLFIRRSRGAACFAALRDELATVDDLVLTGDSFDFRWSTWPDPESTQAAALAWLSQLAGDYPRCDIHFILGNHDCRPGFAAGLKKLAAALPRFHWHEYWLRLGPAAFLHGDCVMGVMDAAALDRYRQGWRQDRHWAAFAAAYQCVDRLKISRLMHHCHFPRQRTVRRIAHYLDAACPGWRRETQDCYFGHTHLAFTNHEHEGIRFHNTGSAIRGMDFNPLFFETPPLELEHAHQPELASRSP